MELKIVTEKYWCQVLFKLFWDFLCQISFQNMLTQTTAIMPQTMRPETKKKAKFCQKSKPVGKKARYEIVKMSQQNTRMTVLAILVPRETIFDCIKKCN